MLIRSSNYMFHQLNVGHRSKPAIISHSYSFHSYNLKTQLIHTTEIYAIDKSCERLNNLGSAYSRALPHNIIILKASEMTFILDKEV
jgi:hypothetical protein